MASFYSIGTISINNGDTTVVGTGTIWLPTNVKEGDVIEIAGQVKVIASVTDDNHLELEVPFSGSNQTNVAYTIEKTSDAWGTNRTLSYQTAKLLEQIEAIDANGRGLFYFYGGSTTNVDPGVNNIAFNASPPSSATEFYISDTDANSLPVSGLLALFGAGATVIVRSIQTAAYVSFSVPAALIGEGTYHKASNLVVNDSGGVLSVGEALGVQFQASGVGVQFVAKGNWNSATTYGANNLVIYGGYAFISNINGNLNNPPTISPAPASSADWTFLPLPGQGDYIDLALFGQGIYSDGDLLFRFEFANSATFPAGLTNSQFSAGVAPTGSVSLPILKNGASIGSINFAAASQTATFTFASDTSFSAGDVLTVFAPNPHDPFLQDVAGTLRGTRDASASFSQKGFTTINFGAYPGSGDASVAVTGIGQIKSDSEVEVSLWPGSGTADHSADEHSVAGMKLTVQNIIAGTGFTIFGQTSERDGAQGSRHYGSWNVAYIWK